MVMMTGGTIFVVLFSIDRPTEPVALTPSAWLYPMLPPRLRLTPLVTSVVSIVVGGLGWISEIRFGGPKGSCTAPASLVCQRSSKPTW